MLTYINPISLLLETPELFKRYLESLPPGMAAGMRATAYSCPLANFLSSASGVVYGVGYSPDRSKVIVTSDDGCTTFKSGGWILTFINAVDGGASMPTAEVCLQFLNSLPPIPIPLPPTEIDNLFQPVRVEEELCQI